jgi:HSP20 family molecular chaperone IbpA
MNAPREKSWMWAEACARLDEAERRHRRFFDLLAVPSAAPAWEPPANIFSLGAELHISIAMPGARAEDVVVQISASGLLIETTVPPPAFAAGMQVVRLEIPYGRLRRRIDLPPGRYVLRENRMENGCLFLLLSGATR